MPQEFRSLESSLAGSWRRVASTATTAQGGDVAISVHSDPVAIEQLWRELERRAAISVYQRFDWVQPWCKHATKSLGIEPAIVLGSQRGGPVFILPLGKKRTGLGIEASWLGCSHVNIGLGIFDPGYAATLDRSGTRRLFRQIAKVLAPVDYIALRNQPEIWADARNPLVDVGNKVNDQPVLAIRLQSDFDAIVSPRRRKKLRWQANRLAPVGGYRFFRAADRAQAAGVFDAFLAQKDQQFAKLGIDNVFDDRGTVDCFRAMIDRSFDHEAPIIELFGLDIDGETRATFAAGAHNGRVHGYFSGISLDEFQHVSPGELLLHNLVQASSQQGHHTLDLGVGEERYKLSWSPTLEHQFSSYLAISMSGRIAIALRIVAQVVRVRIRRNDTAWRIAKRLRQWRAALTRR